MHRALLVILFALPMLAADLSAQVGRRRQAPLAGEAGPRRRQAPLAGEAGPRRQELETRLRQRLWGITKNRVGLSDEQMTKLAQTSQPFDVQRRDLVTQEREQRQALRREILAGPNADQQRIATSLDQMLELQRRRAQLQIDEQRTLGTFMTPLQRAKYAALQEQLRRRAEKLRRQRVTQGETALDSVP